MPAGKGEAVAQAGGRDHRKAGGQRQAIRTEIEEVIFKHKAFTS